MMQHPRWADAWATRIDASPEFLTFCIIHCTALCHCRVIYGTYYMNKWENRPNLCWYQGIGIALHMIA